MNLVTIFDYPLSNENGNILLKVWLTQANLYAHGFNIYVIHGENGVSPANRKFIETKCNNINVTLVSGKKNPTKYGVADLDDNFHVNFNAYNVLTFGQRLNQPIIYMDADALLFSSLHEWWDVVREKPFIGFSHYPLSNKLNAGVYSVSDWGFITFDKLINRYFQNHPNYEEIIKLCGTNDYSVHDSVFKSTGRLKSFDQSLIVNYFVGTDHHPYYEKLDEGWNYWGKYVKLVYENGHWGVGEFHRKQSGGPSEVKIAHYYAQSKSMLFQTDFYKSVGKTNEC